MSPGRPARPTAVLAMVALLLSAGATPYFHTCHPTGNVPLGLAAADEPGSPHRTHAACSACVLGSVTRASVPDEPVVVGPHRRPALLAARVVVPALTGNPSASAGPRAPPSAS